jgi:hypothetical protein
VDPLLNLRLELVEQDVNVFGLAADWGSTIELAAGVNKIKGIEKMTALVALVSTGIIVMAAGALALNIAISQEGTVLLAERLFSGAFTEEPVLMQALEDGLRDLGVLLCGCATEVVEADVEPFIHFLVNLIVLGAKVLG